MDWSAGREAKSIGKHPETESLTWILKKYPEIEHFKIYNNFL